MDIEKKDIRKNVIRRIIQIIITMILTAVILFVSAGRIDWIWAWVYIIIYALTTLSGAFILKPELIAERGRKKENTEKWDKIVTVAILVAWILFYTLSGLDIRFGWSPEMPLWVHIAGAAVFISGTALVFLAMISNPWFSTTVRIQYDRDHSVSDGGPYSYVRHPGYLGMIIYNLATPLIFGALWAFLPAILIIILFIIRTSFEDSTLKAKLPGYKEFAGRVRYRLLPFIW